jgi:hypothetical protein
MTYNCVRNWCIDMYLLEWNGETIMAEYLFTNKDYTCIVDASSERYACAFAREYIARQGFGRMAYNGIVDHAVHATYTFMWRVAPSWHPEADDRKRWSQAERGPVVCAGCQKQMDVRSGTCFNAWYCSDACVPRS